MAEDINPVSGIPVQICYADPEGPIIVDIVVPEKTTLGEAIEQSGLMNRLSLQTGENTVGIFGKKRSWDTLLEAHDRIEIYRPLRTTPQETRRLRITTRRP